MHWQTQTKDFKTNAAAWWIAQMYRLLRFSCVIGNELNCLVFWDSVFLFVLIRQASLMLLLILQVSFLIDCATDKNDTILGVSFKSHFIDQILDLSQNQAIHSDVWK